MTLYGLELHVNEIVKDLEQAKKRRHTDPETPWVDVEHAMDAEIDSARGIEAVFGEGEEKCVDSWETKR